jgi:phage recombination protein Bet
MSTALSIEYVSNITIWEDKQKLEEIRKLFAPKLTDLEFKFFVGMGKATNLNPFLREIWAVKYNEKDAAQTFIGRDGYRKSAQAHKDYDYHQSDAVYENDLFEVADGKIKHQYNLKNRGKLLGAYCITKRKNSERSSFVFAELIEYSTGKSLWKEAGPYKNDKGYMAQGGKPATMIKKVAESQCLRMCFQELFAGTYGEEEMDQTKIENQKNLMIINGNTQTERVKSILNNNVIESEAEEIQQEKGGSYEITDDDIKISDEQIDKISLLMEEKAFSAERVTKVLQYYKVNDLSELSSTNANRLLSQLERS